MGAKPVLPTSQSGPVPSVQATILRRGKFAVEQHYPAEKHPKRRHSFYCQVEVEGKMRYVVITAPDSGFSAIAEPEDSVKFMHVKVISDLEGYVPQYDATDMYLIAD
jgi:hypothetical protein